MSVPLPGLGKPPGDLRRLADSYSRSSRAASARKSGSFRRPCSPPSRLRLPGNLRELRNVIERAVILATGEAVELADLPEEFTRPAAGAISGRAA